MLALSSRAAAVLRAPVPRGIPASGNARPQNWCDAHSVSTRCLIVDDNESFLEAARALLEREGLNVAAVASTYAEALGLFETLRPDVVLVDIFLRRRAAWSLRGT